MIKAHTLEVTTPGERTVKQVCKNSGGQDATVFGGWLCPVGAETNSEQFKAEGERIRMACLAERLAAENSNQRAPLFAAESGSTSMPTGSCRAFGGSSLNEVVKTQDGWQLL